jgi:hypothetical protein
MGNLSNPGGIELRPLGDMTFVFCVAPLYYAWRAEHGRQSLGRALQWWLGQLESPTTRRALVERHAGPLD